MAKKRLLKLTWVDRDGEPYHTDAVSPTVARDLLARAGVVWFRMDRLDFPVINLSWAAVSRSTRAVCAKRQTESGETEEIVIEAV